MRYYYGQLSRPLQGVYDALLGGFCALAPAIRVPLLAPETDYETTIGFRTNVVFPTAALRMDDNIIRIYYGAADTVIAFAEAREEDLIQLCLKGE